MPLDSRAVALIDLVEKHGDDLAERIARRLQAELPTYAALPTADMLAQLKISIGFVSQMLRTDGAGSPTMLAAFSELSRNRTRDGVGAASLARAVRITAREAMEFAQSLADEAQIDTAATFSLATTLWDWVETIVDHLSSSDLAAEEERARNVAAQRFVKASVGGEAGSAEISAAAAACGLDATANYHVLRAVATDRSARSMVSDLLQPSPRRPGAVAVLADEVVAVLAAPPGRSAPFAVGVGPSMPLPSARHSYLVAGRALRTAVLLGRSGLLQLEDVGLNAAVADDADLGEMLVARYVAPLTGLGAFGDELLDSVRRYFTADLNIDDAARVLHIHANTLRHRLARFEQATGANLHSPEHIAEVWWLLTRLQQAAPQPR